MRIRKNASRLLLGSASTILSYYSPPLPPPPPPISASESSSSSSGTASVCEFNCSPWDVIDPKEEGDDRGITENGITTDMSIAAERKIEEEINVARPNKTNKDEFKGNEKLRAEAICNKRGKGWHCTRPAESTHSFCSYHLTILRSYTCDRKGGKKNGAATEKKKKKAAGCSASLEYNSYYYYGGFGPWRGKRRGGADVKVKQGKRCESVNIDERVDEEKDEDDDYSSEDKMCERNHVEQVVACCKRNDGKRWHCKKPAEALNSLCRHNFAQIRSNHGTKNGELKNTVTESPNNKHKRKKAKAAAGSESDFYYYDGFGPRRGKVRGRTVEAEEIIRETSDCNVPAAAVCACDGEDEQEKVRRT